MLIEISVNGIEPVISLGRDNIAVATTNEHIPAATALATGLYGVKTNQVPVCRGHHTLILPNINVRVERKPGHAARNGLHEHQAGREGRGRRNVLVCSCYCDVVPAKAYYRF